MVHAKERQGQRGAGTGADAYDNPWGLLAAECGAAQERAEPFRLGMTYAMARPVRALAIASRGPGKSPTSLAASWSVLAAGTVSVSSGAKAEACREPVRLVTD